MDAVEAGEVRASGHADGHGGDRGRAVARPSAPSTRRIPQWPDRDRFVLSNGHGSMLLYALLHLTGYDLPIDELKRFRQLHSKTPGHPEVRRHARRRDDHRAARAGARQRGRHGARRDACSPPSSTGPGHAIVDHRTYVFVGDGCLMEGISHEACSLAGTLGLGKLDRALRRQRHLDRRRGQGLVHRRHAAALRGLRLARASATSTATTSPRSTRRSRRRARRRRARPPQLICCKTVIGKGAPNKAGTADAHGAALGEKEVAATRAALGWTSPAVRDARRRSTPPGTRARAARRSSRRGPSASPRTAPRTRSSPPSSRRRMAGELPAAGTSARGGRRRSRPRRARPSPRARPRSRRSKRSRRRCPELVGGSADLTGSVLTNWSGSKAVGRQQPGNYIHFGVREFAMSAIANGLALHGGFIPYVGTFLTFSDYARNALRMAALMKLRAIFVYTHDSIGLGEDGPTHQSIEHAASLRLIPGHGRLAPLRHGGDGGRLGRRDRARRRADGAAVHAPELAVPAARRRAIGDIRRGGYVLADWNGERGARGDHRDRLRGRARDVGARERSPTKASPCAWCRCPAPASSSARTPPSAQACCRPACRASRSRPASPTAGASTSAPPTIRAARWSASTVRRIGARGRAVQAFRLHRRQRRRGGEAPRDEADGVADAR